MRWFALPLVLLGVGCGSAPPIRPPIPAKTREAARLEPPALAAAPEQIFPSPACARLAPAARITPVSPTGVGGSVVLVEPGEDPAAPLQQRCTVAAPAEPTGLALTPDGARLLVTSRWGHALTAYEIGTLKAHFTASPGSSATASPRPTPKRCSPTCVTGMCRSPASR